MAPVPVLTGLDVVDAEPHGGMLFGHPAIFAAMPGAFADELPRRRIHQFGEEGFSVAWAWALRMPRKVFARTMASNSRASSGDSAP